MFQPNDTPSREECSEPARSFTEGNAARLPGEVLPKTNYDISNYDSEIKANDIQVLSAFPSILAQCILLFSRK